MFLVIQVPAKHSYFVIRGKLPRLRILQKNGANFVAINSFSDLDHTKQNVVFIPSEEYKHLITSYLSVIFNISIIEICSS